MERATSGKTRPDLAKDQPRLSKTPVKEKPISVIFNVIVPEDTTDHNTAVFLVGSFKQFHPSLPDWDPRGLEMKRLAPNQWSITVMGQPQTEIEYKYTLGDWNQVEGDEAGNDLPNRRLVLNAGSSEGWIIEDIVKTWRKV